MRYKMMEIFTDGGCSGNPGPGGWAFTLDADHLYRTQMSGGEAMTTNNRMELKAVINALSHAGNLEAEAIRVNTDSQYVKNGMTTWIRNWKVKGWRTADGKAVKNRDLWVELDALVSSLPVSFHWVKGHAGVKMNELCDSLVQKEIRRIRDEKA